MQLTKENLILYDPEFEKGADTFLGEVGGSSDKYPIKRWEDLETALHTYRMVRFLVFDTHGKPGAICLPDGANIEGIDFLLLKPNRNLLQSNARILFYGCSVGNGKSGDDFMDDVGRYILKGKGGIVGAATVEVDTFPIFAKLGMFKESYLKPETFTEGSLKVKKYDASGVRTGSIEVDRYGNAK
jgi:hypothetical protein